MSDNLDALNELAETPAQETEEATNEQVDSQPDVKTGQVVKVTDNLVKVLGLESQEVLLVEAGAVESTVSQGGQTFVVGNESIMEV